MPNCARNCSAAVCPTSSTRPTRKRATRATRCASASTICGRDFPQLDAAVARCAEIVRAERSGDARAAARNDLRERLRRRDLLRDIPSSASRPRSMRRRARGCFSNRASRRSTATSYEARAHLASRSRVHRVRRGGDRDGGAFDRRADRAGSGRRRVAADRRPQGRRAFPLRPRPGARRTAAGTRSPVSRCDRGLKLRQRPPFVGGGAVDPGHDPRHRGPARAPRGGHRG